MSLSKLTRGLFVSLLFISHWAFAQTPSELQFQSRFDQFTLQRVGSNYKLDGKTVKLGPFEGLLSLFNKEIEGACSIKGKPDLTVKAKVGADLVERRFYINERLVSDGKQCGTVTGEGLYYSPLHKSWFDDTAKPTITLESPVSISKGEEKLASFAMVNGEWVNTLKEEFPNWEYFNTFKDALREFSISHRLHKAAATGKPGFVLTSGKRKYEFFKVTDTMWATTLPGTGWLVASPRWSSWNDMDKSLWVDRNSAQLSVLADSTKGIEERKGALGTIEGQWSPSIRQALAQILLTADESTELKQHAVRLMKSKPTLENMGTMVQALSHTNDSDLQRAISLALKVRYPKGPTINVDMEDASRRQAIAEWQKWWKGQKNSD